MIWINYPAGHPNAIPHANRTQTYITKTASSMGTGRRRDSPRCRASPPALPARYASRPRPLGQPPADRTAQYGPRRRLAGHQRQDHSVEHDRQHDAAEQITAVAVHQVPPAPGLIRL
jgi:hypothetical protein